MTKITKSGAVRVSRTPEENEIDLINRYTLKELKADEVYTFTCVLCNTDTDRDFEYFTEKALGALSGLFLGKTGIFDHARTANNQIARIYDTFIEDTGKKTADGRRLLNLCAKVYIPKTEDTEGIIAKIDSGILKEISISAKSRINCSICGERIGPWGEYRNMHREGEKYDGRTCFGIIDEPVDAYEFSFVAVPSQKDAGVRKSRAETTLASALKIMKKSSYEYDAMIAEWYARMNSAFEERYTAHAEIEKRKSICEDNKKIMEDLKK